jgi:lysophospholipase L1-like esterase
MFRLVLTLLLTALAALAQSGFYLKDGDRVVFYGDSITDQRLYTTFVETFVRTRLPKLNVEFTHSGWGGDRVGGGGGGTVETRVDRDVAPFKPTVVTIMLGMNDGRYRPFDEDLFKAYTEGYEKLLGLIRAQTPGVRITLIRPSPYDEVTREPMAGGGYNPVLVRYGDYLQQLGAKEKWAVADLNAPVVQMLEKAKTEDAALAPRIIPDRVHPGVAGHLIMAAALLKAWDAPGLVSDVEIDATTGRAVKSQGAAVSGVQRREEVTWTEKDEALPMAVNFDDPVTALAVRSSDFIEALNRQPLKVTGLKPGDYALRIDGMQVGVFTANELAAGLNLGALPTPMARQAAEVHRWTLKRTATHNTRWRTFEVPMEEDQLAKEPAALAALDALEGELEARQKAEAQPVERHYEVAPVPAYVSAIPRGFTPVFNGKDLTGWHISRTNHHGTTPLWQVENGILTGTQNPVGKGGILLTDKRYKNFEIYLEVNPDWGCDGGLFLRSSEKGEAYQVLLDYRENGTLFGVYGEALKGVKTYSIEDWRKYWKEGEWNGIRARIEGFIPHIQVWVNGQKVTDWVDTANHAADNAGDGMIAVQVHGGTQIWKEGGKHRFRNIAIRELP